MDSTLLSFWCGVIHGVGNNGMYAPDARALCFWLRFVDVFILYCWPVSHDLWHDDPRSGCGLVRVAFEFVLIPLRCADVNIFVVTYGYLCFMLSCDLSLYCFMILLVACHIGYIWIMHGIDIFTYRLWIHVVVQFLYWAFVLIPLYNMFQVLERCRWARWATC